MNNKMTINIYRRQLNLKNKLSKQEKQRQNQGYGEGFHSCQMGGVVGDGWRGEGIKKYK